MTNKFKLFYIKKTLFFFFLFLFIDGYSYYQCQVIISLTGTALNTGRTKRLGIPHHLSSPLSKEERERKRKDVMIYVNTSEGTWKSFCKGKPSLYHAYNEIRRKPCALFGGILYIEEASRTHNRWLGTRRGASISLCLYKQAYLCALNDKSGSTGNSTTRITYTCYLTKSQQTINNRSRMGFL